MGAPRPSPAISPDIVSPRPQRYGLLLNFHSSNRLTPSMPANLAQNLDSASRSPQPSTTQRNSEQVTSRGIGSESYQLPPLDTKRQDSVDSLASSQYTGNSALDEYLKSDSFPTTAPTGSSTQQAPNQTARSNPYNAPSAQVAPQPPRNDPYTTSANYASPPQRNDPYSTYNAPPGQLYGSLPPPQSFSDSGRPPRPTSSQGRPQQQQYPPPPPMVDYSKKADYATASSGQRQSYQQPYQGQGQQRRPSAEQSHLAPQEQYYPSSSNQSSGRPGRASSPRPFSQDLSNTNISQSGLANPRRNSAYQNTSLNANEFIEMPDVSVPSFDDLRLNDLPPPSRPSESTARPSPRQSPRIAPSNVAIAMASPPSLIPQSEYEWENEIDSQRENALRTNDPNIALTWAEKVYMYVSISLDELRREQEIAAADAGVIARPSTPTYERGLREDCIRIVEKFVQNGNPKAVHLSVNSC
jgi:hypothetical protein